MIKYVAIILGIISFAIWMNIVGNPHYIETILGVVLGICVSFFSHKELTKFSNKF